jgi:hypothetical protein
MPEDGDRHVLPGKHRRERPGVKHHPDGGDLAALDLMPFRNECRAGRRLGDQVVREAYIVSIDKHLLQIDSLDDVMQFLERVHVCIRLVKRFDRPLE